MGKWDRNYTGGSCIRLDVDRKERGTPCVKNEAGIHSAKREFRHTELGVDVPVTFDFHDGNRRTELLAWIRPI